MNRGEDKPMTVDVDYITRRYMEATTIETRLAWTELYLSQKDIEEVTFRPPLALGDAVESK